MQIGLFRLLQGAAYRCFRESFNANHETHLRVRNLPYRITDFVEFVKTAIRLYKGLGVVEEACYPVLDAVVESLADEYAQLEKRIKHWKTVEKTPEMLAEEKAMLAARGSSATVKEKFAAGVEFAITVKKKSLSLRDIAEGVLAINELNRLRKIELNEEMTPPSTKSEEEPKEYLKKWNRVILSNALEEVDGAMIPVAYWYEEFMPKLLAAFSEQTRANRLRRFEWKLVITRRLYERRFSRQDVLNLFQFIDWVMSLPEELEQQFWQEVRNLEEDLRMPYITSVERIATEKGLQQGMRQGLLEGIELDLELKFGSDGLSIFPEVSQIQDVEQLRAIHRGLKTANTLEEVLRLYQSTTSD